LKFGVIVAIFPNLVANNYKSHVVINGLVTFWLISTNVQTLVDLGKMRKSALEYICFANEERWKPKILWGLPPTESSNKARLFSHAPNSKCFKSIKAF